MVADRWGDGWVLIIVDLGLLSLGFFFFFFFSSSDFFVVAVVFFFFFFDSFFGFLERSMFLC